MSTGAASAPNVWLRSRLQPEVARWIYYSSGTGNTARLMSRSGLAAWRIPTHSDEAMPEPTGPYILVTPTFGDAQGRGAVPKPVIRFLNEPHRRQWLRAIVACGDRNFGASFAQAGDVIARKCGVPVVHRFELRGTQHDIQRLQDLDRSVEIFFAENVSEFDQ